MAIISDHCPLIPLKYTHHWNLRLSLPIAHEIWWCGCGTGPAAAIQMPPGASMEPPGGSMEATTACTSTPSCETYAASMDEKGSCVK